MNEVLEMQNVQAITSNDALLNPAIMAHVNNLADVMAKSHVTVPKHLQGSIGDCFAVVLQSMQWGMNPFAVAQKTHLVNGTLGYEAQLVNAVITTRAPTKDRLKFEWFGEWSGIKGKENNSTEIGVRVSATFKGEEEPRILELTMAQVGKVRNSPLWESDPRQQLAYLAIKRWARLHCPDVILGVYTPDEIEEPKEINVTPNASQAKPNSGASALKARLKKVVETQEEAKEINLSEYYQAIEHAQNLEQLDQVGAKIKELSLGEPAKSELRQAFKAKRDQFVFPDSSIQSKL